MQKQKGNALLVILVIVALGIGAYYLATGKSQQPAPEATEETTGSTESNETVKDESTEGEDAMTAEGEVEVSIENFAFSPKTITVKPGTTISVTNLDSVGHTLTADNRTSFDTGMLNKGETATITAPDEPGEYPFHCTPHPYMTGTIVVEG